MRSLKNVLSLLLIFSVLLASGCKNSPHRRTAAGGAIGAAAGAGVGAAIGSRTGKTAEGAIFGAAVGGVAGAAIGAVMDRQAEELRRDLAGAKVERVGEGIKITFDSGILFDVNSAELKQPARENLNNMARTLQKYPDTELLVEGHTDDTGPRDNNLRLSERRAGSVKGYLEALGVASNRLKTKGWGPDQPQVEGTTDAARRANRRVEVAIYANDKMQRAAKRGQL
jgi:outer membrane protein OmpA-like peptidoglycan-associated protein